MDRERKTYLRGILFRHLDGITLCPVISSLHKKRITQFILDHSTFTIKDILIEFECNNGYINVALRLLCSQGWLEQNIIDDGNNIQYKLTEKGKQCFPLAHHYDDYTKLIPVLINIDRYLFDPNVLEVQNNIQHLLDKMKAFNVKYNSANTSRWEIGRHLEGLFIGPVLVALGMSNYFLENIEDNCAINDVTYNKFPLLKSVLDFFITLGWIKYDNNDYHFTDIGLFFIKRSTAYGVTVSYLPTFHNTSELLFGNPNILWKRNSEGLETHVNRRMNVWGSGGAHSIYFKKIDEIITHIFNQPIDNQPIGIADMGCGDGTMLKHLYNVVKNQTKRGKCLELYPLKIIGADFNKAARIASTITLQKALIEHSILHGDISNPSDYAENLKNQCGLDLQEMLNVRSFLDHNRIYSLPKKPFQDNICHSTGAFAFRGRWIPNKELKQNLIEHFTSWKNYVSKYGLLMLELHTISPELTARNLGKTVATAYDGTHGFSDQYIIEVEIMLEAAEQAGLISDPKYKARFPNDELTTISINLFRPKN